MKSVKIYSDGACHGNPGPGGWGAVLEYGRQRRELSGGVPATTNNRMELLAAIEGLRALKERCNVEFYTDSQYLRQGVTEWIHGWKRNGWRTREKKPVKNSDLWQALDAVASRHKIAWHWLKGHAGHKGNERCDELANAAIAHIKKTMPPEELSAALLEFLSARNAPETLFHKTQLRQYG